MIKNYMWIGSKTRAGKVIGARLFIAAACRAVFSPQESAPFDQGGRIIGYFPAKSMRDAFDLARVGLNLFIRGKVMFSVSNGSIQWFDAPDSYSKAAS